MDFAVHLGSDSTVIYKKNEGIVLNEATCIAYMRVAKKSRSKKNTDKNQYIRVIAAGDTAKKMQDKTDGQIFVESPVSGGRITDTELCKLFFKEVTKRLGAEFHNKSALFCIPCSLAPDELDAFKSVAYSAGFIGAEFVPSVIASAIGNGFDVRSPQACLSVHIGESVTDIAAIAFCGIVAGGTIPDGVLSASEAVKTFIEKKHKIDISDRMARSARRECETLLVNNEVSYKVRGADTETGAAREVWLNGIDCYKILLPVYGRITKAAQQIITECTPEVSNDIRTGEVYVGGAGSSPIGLREFLTTNLDINVVVDSKSTNSVITGAGSLLNDKELLKKIIRAN